MRYGERHRVERVGYVTLGEACRDLLPDFSSSAIAAGPNDGTLRNTRFERHHFLGGINTQVLCCFSASFIHIALVLKH